MWSLPSCSTALSHSECIQHASQLRLRLEGQHYRSQLVDWQPKETQNLLVIEFLPLQSSSLLRDGITLKALITQQIVLQEECIPLNSLNTTCGGRVPAGSTNTLLTGASNSLYLLQSQITKKENFLYTLCQTQIHAY